MYPFLYRQSFLERQQIFEKKAKSNKHSLEEEFDSKLRDCFKPDIDPGSRKIVASKRPEQLLEGPEQRYQRMTYAALLEREKWRQEQEQRIYGSIPFQPTIDPLSRSLGRKHDIDELSENYRGKQIKELIRQKILAVENKNCTFQPKINDLSRHLLEKSDEYEDYANEYKHTGWNECPIADLASSREAKKPQSYSRINFAEPELMAQDIRLNLLKKEEKRRSELLAKEMKELQDCSFQPSIIRIPPHIKKVQAGNDDPIVIRGLGRHLELMHLSARKKDEALQREQEVFSVKNVEKYRRAEDGSTIIQVLFLFQPFHNSMLLI